MVGVGNAQSLRHSRQAYSIVRYVCFASLNGWTPLLPLPVAVEARLLDESTHDREAVRAEITRQEQRHSSQARLSRLCLDTLSLIANRAGCRLMDCHNLNACHVSRGSKGKHVPMSETLNAQ